MQGLAPDRNRAAALIMAGRVCVAGRRIDKAGDMVDSQMPLQLKQAEHGYVSRGGVKLAGALKAFSLVPEGLTIVDVGASTGGFTDCLLQQGAHHVYAVDVGFGLLHPKLRDDRRVTVVERTNARYLDTSLIAHACDWAVIDASFISLTLLLAPVCSVIKADGKILALVKPQFEARREHVETGGLVHNPEHIREALDKVIAFAHEQGLQHLGECAAPIRGPQGNQEYFLWLQR